MILKDTRYRMVSRGRDLYFKPLSRITLLNEIIGLCPKCHVACFRLVAKGLLKFIGVEAMYFSSCLLNLILTKSYRM